jgi:hypothetical protein
MNSRHAVSKTVALVVVLVAGLAIGFSGGWLLQEQTIVKLTNAESSQAIYVDSASKEVMIQATVNNAAFVNATMHGLNWEGGSIADQAAFTTIVTPHQLYDALVSLGATPSNNVQMNSPAGTLTTGPKVTVYVTWGSNKYLLTQLFNNYTLPQGDGTFGFGGNLATNTEVGTGCMCCLFSCAIGIVSSNTNGWKSMSMWTLNSSLIPHGQNVTFIFQLAS